METNNIEIIRSEALRLIENGFSVIPLGGGSDGKRPLIKEWKPFQERIATSDEINSWCDEFGNKMQIGIVTGTVSGITVIDVEAGGNWSDLPETCISKTGRNGRHFVYRYHDKIKNGVKLWPLTDIRNDGGYVVVPPSFSSFGSYEWTKPLDRTDLAEFPAKLFDEKSARWRKLCNDYRGVPEGGRHNAMLSRTGTLLKRIPESHWETEVWPQLVCDNHQNIPPLEESELRRMFDDISKAEKTSRTTKVGAVSASNASEEIAVHSCAEILATPPKDDQFVVDRLVPMNMVNALTSQAGVGKSLIALEMARCVASGEPFLGHYKTEQMPVLILDQEMSENVIVGRFHSLIEDPSIPLYTAYGTFLKIANPDDFKKIVDIIAKYKIGLLVMDTLVTFCEGDENQVGEMRPVMEAMMRLCVECGVTVLFAHHQRKGAYGEQASLSSMRGSTEIGAKVGCQMTLECKEKETDEVTGEMTMTITMEQHKSRMARGFKKFSIKSVYNENTKKSTLTYEGECEPKKSKKEEQKYKVAALLAERGGQMTRQEIITSVGAQKNTDKALAELLKEGAVKEESQKGSKAKLYSLVDATNKEGEQLEIQEVDY